MCHSHILPLTRSRPLTLFLPISSLGQRPHARSRAVLIRTGGDYRGLADYARWPATAHDLTFQLVLDDLEENTLLGLFDNARSEQVAQAVSELSEGFLTRVVRLDLGNRAGVIVNVDLVVHDFALAMLKSLREDVDAFLLKVDHSVVTVEVRVEVALVSVAAASVSVVVASPSAVFELVSDEAASVRVDAEYVKL